MGTILACFVCGFVGYAIGGVHVAYYWDKSEAKLYRELRDMLRAEREKMKKTIQREVAWAKFDISLNRHISS